MVYSFIQLDLNFLTIHAPTKYPGLFVWSEDGKKYPINIP